MEDAPGITGGSGRNAEWSELGLDRLGVEGREVEAP